MWEQTLTLGERTLSFQTGKIARQAHGAVLLREGKTVILSTVVHNGGEGERDFLPLTVDFRAYHAAAGRIPGSFNRREGRSSDYEILASRLCDRSLRPLFPDAFRGETQVLSTVLSAEPDSDLPVLAMNSAAAALHLSEIPWEGPLAAVRVGRIGGKLVALPGPKQMLQSDLDLVLSVSREGIVMIEGGAKEVPEADVVQALDFAREQLQPVLALMEALRKAEGRTKLTLPPPPPDPEYLAALTAKARPALDKALCTPEKHARRTAVQAAKQQALEDLLAGLPPESASKDAPAALNRLEEKLVREAVAKEGRRVDGRGPKDIRPIDCEVDWLPSTHGSALFTRGETQAMVILTLGTTQDRQMLDMIDGIQYDRFLLHYHFPPYSVGEARPMRGPGRREVGHGMLAKRALDAVLPADTQFPYTVRIVSEISESNGSSSMATVCGGCLALMDGGVPIKAPVAGIAMGLIKEGDKLVILSDILGDEDHLGDMDFKVAGTATGITALQMDNKLGSLPPAIMTQAFEQARAGRVHILGEMAKALKGPREEMKPTAPLVSVLNIATNRIRDLIGPGGKVIQEIQRTSGAKVEVDDTGTVRIFAPNRAARDIARNAVQEKAGSLEVGAIYDGVVTGVKEFGAFVRIRGQEGLVHKSEWDVSRTENMAAVTKEGEAVRVKVLSTDKAGKLSLSRKAAL